MPRTRPGVAALPHRMGRCETAVVRCVDVRRRRRPALRDPSVARWAGQPIDVGNGTVFRQHIIGPETGPKLSDAAQATRDPDLAMLSIFIHARRNTPAAHLMASATLRSAGELFGKEKRNGRRVARRHGHRTARRA